jgi:hypothetical protein
MKKEKPKILLSLAGGLGNQLFQLAAALDLSRGHEVELETGVAHPRRNQLGEAEIQSFILPDRVKIRKLKYPNWLMVKNTNLFLRFSASDKDFHKIPGYRILLLISSIINSMYFREWRRTLAAKALGYSQVEVGPGKVFLIGLFQSHKWVTEQSVFKAMRALEVKHPSEELLLLQQASKQEIPLVVHVRLGDYLSEDSFGIPNQAYYKRAIDSALEKNNYNSLWLFSNDLLLARDYLPSNISIPIREIGDIGTSSAETLHAMRFGNGYVIANSTFSWWGAFLSMNSNAPVYFPDPWFKSTHSPEYLTPSHWIPVASWD